MVWLEFCGGEWLYVKYIKSLSMVHAMSVYLAAVIFRLENTVAKFTPSTDL